MIRIRIRMCISVNKFQREQFDVSQKPLIQKMHTEPEILNWGVGGVIRRSDLELCDSPARYYSSRGDLSRVHSGNRS